MLWIYRTLISLIFWLGWPIWVVMGAFQWKWRRGALNRLAFYPPDERADGAQTRVWIHGASVGELQTAAPLIRALAERPNMHVTVSALTPTGYETAVRDFSEIARVVYWPFEVGWAIRRAYARLRPDLLLIFESDFWPAVLHEGARRGVPILLVNGRVSERAFRRMRPIAVLYRTVLTPVRRFLMRADEDAERIRLLLGPTRETDVQVLGNLKYAALFARSSRLEGADGLLAWMEGGPCAVVASTHEGEEVALAPEVARWLERPEVRVVVAPRHPERAGAVAQLFAGGAERPVMRSTLGAGATPESRLVVLDTVGELFGLMGHARVVVMGGSLDRTGGHNVLEAAFHGVPVVYGPRMENFREEAALLEKRGAALRRADAAGVGEAVLQLLQNPDDAIQMGAQGREALAGQEAVLERLLAQLEPWLKPGADRNTV